MAYCCLVHIYKWPIIILYIFPNAYCVDMTFFIWPIVCYDTYIFQVILFKSSFQVNLFKSFLVKMSWAGE